MQLKICLLGILIILIGRHLINHKWRENLSLNSPYLPKDDPSKETQLSCVPSQ